MRAVAVALLLAIAFPAAAQSLAIRIVDAETNGPVSATVEVLETRDRVSAAPDGRCAVAVGTSPRITLVVSHDGYYVQRVSVDPATTSEVEVQLVRTVSLVDRIEVTATRAREGIDPVSFTNVPQARVQEAYWGQDPAMLLSQVVPGFYATNDSGNGIGYSYFSIRGFGQARTRVMLNGAPLNDAESGELFFIDLADFMATAGDVQVQRGVFGLSGLGGAVDVTTATPSPSPLVSLDIGAGSFGTRRVSAKWDSGLVRGQWAFTTRFSKIETDGYRDQSWVDMWNLYASAARFGERSRLRVVVFGGPEKTHLAYDGVPREVLEGGLTGDPERDRRHNPITFPGEIDRFTQPHYQVVHEYQWSAATRLSETVYLFQGDGSYDQFRANRNLFEYALPNVVLPDGQMVTRSDLIRRRSVDEWDSGWVPTFTHGTGRWTWELQGEVRVHRAHHVGEVTWAQFYPPTLAPNQRYYDYRAAKNTASAAGEVRYDASSGVQLTGGLQVARHAYELSHDRLKGQQFSERYDFVLPRAGATVQLAPSAHAYVGVARGMREPFFRDIYDPQDYYGARASLDPEDVWDVEAGLSMQKSRWRARGNVFWMKFLNEIVYAGAIDDNGVPIYGNGARSRRLGAELEGSVTLTPSFGLEGALTMTRNTFTRYREFDFEGGSVVYDGNRVAGFPGLMASITARADWRGTRVSATARHVGRFYLDNTQNPTRVNPAYTIVDLAGRVPVPTSWTGKTRARVAFDVRVNNLFDERYTTFGYVADGVPLYIPAATRNVFAGLSIGF